MGQREYEQLREIGQAVFRYLDAVGDELRQHPGGPFARRLQLKVPAMLLKQLDLSPVLKFRPDFVLVPTPAGPQFVLTEIEIAPFSHGCAEAMQIAYGVTADTVKTFADFLAGRELIFLGTEAWSVYLFDQLAFCRMLAEVGARGRVHFDRPVAEMEAEIQAGRRWTLPIRGVDNPPEPWQPSLLKHLRRHQLEEYVLDEMPLLDDDAVLFRFGYVDSFAPSQWAQVKQWQANGTTIVNPFAYYLDSKVLLTGLQDETIRRRLDDATLGVLDLCIPETMVVNAAALPKLLDEQAEWLIKYAGFDVGGESWGGQSINFGRELTPTAWREMLLESQRLAWPVVAQRVAMTTRVSLAHYQENGTYVAGQKGYSRLRTFFLRRDIGGGGETMHCGSHLTVTAEMNVSEQAQGAIQTPIEFLL